MVLAGIDYCASRSKQMSGRFIALKVKATLTFTDENSNRKILRMTCFRGHHEHLVH